MLLTSADGASVGLRPTRYPFPNAAGDPGDPGHLDANWLQVRGTVRTTDGPSWGFEQPCLETVEAQQLLDWLRSAAHGRVPVVEEPTEDDEDAGGVLTFTEPNLAFSLAARRDDRLTLRVRFSHECAPGYPGVDEEMVHAPRSRDVLLRLTEQDLLDAADAWREDLAPFPRR